ncbi:hypothetical protein GC173_16680 [bacterium]|nr:hypothetical protein [bacterium]
MDRWGKQVRYGGKPEHKRNPRDFNLNPPASPRPHKSCCDDAGDIDLRKATALLKAAFREGWISKNMRNGFPQNVWVVDSDTGIPFEAQLENAENGTYHGYPLTQKDPFRAVILRESRKTKKRNRA